MVLGDSKEGLDSSVGLEEENEDEETLLKQAIALSLEGAEENDNEEEDNNEEDAEEDGEEEEEELMLRQAIALSLEWLEEEDDQGESSWFFMHPETLSICHDCR